ncbi:hypothetical protein ACTA71_002675 [Dictyostelium dimigraforme]
MSEICCTTWQYAIDNPNCFQKIGFTKVCFMSGNYSCASSPGFSILNEELSYIYYGLYHPDEIIGNGFKIKGYDYIVTKSTNSIINLSNTKSGRGVFIYRSLPLLFIGIYNDYFRLHVRQREEWFEKIQNIVNGVVFSITIGTTSKVHEIFKTNNINKKR